VYKRQDPFFVKQMILSYQPLDAADNTPLSLQDAPQRGISGIELRYFYRQARRYRLYREHLSFLYTKTYGRLRPYWLELGRRMVERGLLCAPEDVFYLYQDEAKAALAGDTSKDYARLATDRCQEMAALQNLVLPVVIYGDTPPPVVGISEDRLSGIPASRGVYTGRVRVVRSVGDIARLQAGDVLVVPYTDVGWTPLFAQAGGVIAESGGLLSHSSIIAREYHIPAVVSVAGATLLKDNTLVTIDGYKGEVLIHKDGEEYGRTGDRVGSERAAQAV
jgi:pyruvate,water dikinase